MRDSLMPVRQSFALSFFFDAEELTVAQGLIEANPYGDWYLPLWTDQSRGGAILSTDTVIACDTAGAYVAGGRAVIWESRTSHVVATIASVGSGTITLTAPVGQAFTAPVVAPIRTAFAPDGMETERVYHDFATATVKFILRDADATETSPFATYLSRPVLSDLSLAVSGATGAVRQEVTVLDNGFGFVAVETLRDVVETVYSASWQDETLSDLTRRRRWLNYLRGRDGTFWHASRSREMQALAAIGAAATTFTIRPVLPAPSDYIGRHVAFNGSIYREITNAALSGSDHVLTIAATGQALTDPEICFLRRYRLDADEITMNHIGNRRAVGAVPIREVPA